MPVYGNLNSVQYHEKSIQTSVSFLKETVSSPTQCMHHVNALADLLECHPQQHEILKYQDHIHELFFLAMDNFQYISHTDLNYQVTYDSHKFLMNHMFEKLGHHLNGSFAERVLIKFEEQIRWKCDIDWTVHCALKIMDTLKFKIIDRHVQQIFDLFLRGGDCRFWKVLDHALEAYPRVITPIQIQWAFHEFTKICGSGMMSEHLALKIVEKFFYNLREMDAQKAFDQAISPVYCYDVGTNVARAPLLAAKIETKLFRWLRQDQKDAVYIAKAIVKQGCWITWHACNSDWVVTAAHNLD
jgi:hypothetical protein